jgi:hypothetical protein
MRRLDIFPFLLLLAAGPAGAAMYKWTDASGNVSYGQSPPPGVSAEPIHGATAPRSAPGEAKSPQERLKALEKQQEAQKKSQAKEDKKRQQAADRKTNCEHARKNLERLSNMGNRRVRMPDGSYQRLDDQKKQALIDKNRKAIKDFCD